MNKEYLLSIWKGAMTALSLIVSVINLVDFGAEMYRKYHSAATTSTSSSSTEDIIWMKKT